jgi:hypothetical protein
VAPSQQGTGDLLQIGPTGGPATIAEGPGLYDVYRLLFDGNDFYAAVIGGDASPGSLVRVPGGGGTPVLLGIGTGVAIDDDCVYTGDVEEGVYSVLKSSAATMDGGG